ncbi:MAG: vWA domain-containing protein, partial [Miltoncostaeaceae bacterium]
MTFLSPMWLWGLLLVPVLVGLAIAWERQRGVAARAFADSRVMSVGADRPGRLLRRSALALAIVAVAMGPIALARPAVDTTEEKRQGAVVLAIDTSLSMNKDDLKPSRLVAAREAANRFLDAAPDEVRVGLVTFDEKAVVRVAPTLDRPAVRAALDDMPTAEGTALGSAVVAGLGSLAGAGVLDTLPPTPQESAGRMLILTDGAGNVGVSPEEATQRARDKRVPLYTVMLGDDPGRPDRPAPPVTLASMATQTGGVFAQTASTDDLVRIFEDIGGALTQVSTVRQLTVLAPLIALLCLSGAGVLMSAVRR